MSVIGGIHYIGVSVRHEMTVIRFVKWLFLGSVLGVWSECPNLNCLISRHISVFLHYL